MPSPCKTSKLRLWHLDQSGFGFSRRATHNNPQHRLVWTIAVVEYVLQLVRAAIWKIMYGGSHAGEILEVYCTVSKSCEMTSATDSALK